MRPFRERNPLPIGITGIVIILVLLVGAFNASHLPFLGGGRTVTAMFADSSNLLVGDDVRVAGVKVGKVSAVALDGNAVKVTMTVDNDVPLGDTTHADIKIKTLLGQMYVDVTPQGTGSLTGAIPVARTTTPLSVTGAFIQLGQTEGQIDTQQLATAFKTIADTFRNTPSYVKSSLTGLQRLSTTIASRDQQLQNLLSDANGVTATLAARDAQITKLINDSSLILQTVYQQRQVIHQLLIDTAAVSQQLSGLVRDNQAILGPALAHLNATLTILTNNQTQLDETIHLAAPFIRDFTDVLGNGRWFETVVWNLPAGAAGAGCTTLGPVSCIPLPGSSGVATTPRSSGARSTTGAKK